jgi:CBS domain-containing protein
VVKVREIMTTEVVSVGPETPFKDVIDCLVRSELSGLPVVDASGKLVGLVTEADVISKEAYGSQRHRALALPSDVLSG